MRKDCEVSEGVVAAQRNEGATWERENIVRANYPFLFEDEGMLLVIW